MNAITYHFQALLRAATIAAAISIAAAVALIQGGAAPAFAVPGCTYSFANSTPSGVEGSLIGITVNRTSGSCQDQNLKLTFGGIGLSPATSGVDYSVVTNPVIIPFTSGITTQTYNLTTMVNSSSAPHSLNVTMSLDVPAGDTATAVATVTILDNGASAPTVTAVSPTFGTSGSLVMITGTGFGGVICPGGVKFGLTAVTSCTVNNANSITAVVPPGVGIVHVTVTNGLLTSATSAADQFNYSGFSTPTINFISPATGPVFGGTVVTLYGTNLYNPVSITIGSVPCTGIAGYGTTATCVTPAGFGGPYNVTFNGLGGSTTLPFAFTYGLGSGPVVTGLYPNTGPSSGLNYVTILGSGFTNVTSVTFGGVAATVFDASDPNSLTVIAPPHIAGSVSVIVTTIYGTSVDTAADNYLYTGSILPVVSSVSPNTGKPGDLVIIGGSGFTGATGVTFGGVSATFTVLSDTQVRATVPTGAVVGQVDIRVVNSAGTSATSSGDLFTNQGTTTTFTYTLYFRWTPIEWKGAEGMSIQTALTGSASGTNNVLSSVTAVWYFDPATQTFKGWFPSGVGIPGAVDITTFHHGGVYWLAISAPGSLSWTITQTT